MQIELQNISKKFNTNNIETTVLKNINLNIEAGDTVAITGASGAGKSTLMHIMGTLDEASSGHVFFNGENISEKSSKQQAAFRNKNLGFVFQFHHLLPDLTATENVMLPLLIGKINKSEALQRAKNALSKVGLQTHGHQKPSQLSGGEQQRVAIARAFVNNPSIILADEPTGNLDSANEQKVFDLLLSLNRELRVTLVVVTHNELLAKKLNRTVHLVDGQNQNS